MQCLWPKIARRNNIQLNNLILWKSSFVKWQVHIETLLLLGSTTKSKIPSQVLGVKFNSCLNCYFFNLILVYLWCEFLEQGKFCFQLFPISFIMLISLLDFPYSFLILIIFCTPHWYSRTHSFQTNMFLFSDDPLRSVPPKLKINKTRQAT